MIRVDFSRFGLSLLLHWMIGAVALLDEGIARLLESFRSEPFADGNFVWPYEME